MERADFDRIFAEYAPRVRAYLLRQGLSASVSDEVTQEVMLAVWTRSERFDPEKGSLATWIFTIARNRLIDSVRRQRRPAPDPTDPVWVGEREEDSTPESATSRLGRTRALRDAIALLPDEQRKVLEGLYYEGRSMGDIARATDTPLGTVKTRARLALRALRGRLGDDE